MDNNKTKNIRELQGLFKSESTYIPSREKENVRMCINCGRRLVRQAKGDLCPMCAEQELFCKVRDYIRANDVKDYDVAQKFGIPIAKVKEWIRQGRIQYKDDPTMKNVIMGNYCQVCGSPISFGTICTRCMKEKKKKDLKGVAIGQPKETNTKMRFMEDDHNK